MFSAFFATQSSSVRHETTEKGSNDLTAAHDTRLMLDQVSIPTYTKRVGTREWHTTEGCSDIYMLFRTSRGDVGGIYRVWVRCRDAYMYIPTPTMG